MEKERIFWIDFIRIAACVLVVVGHCCDPFVGKLTDNYTDFLAGVGIGSFARPTVPLFMMMTALLLLPVRQDLSQFYRKRIGRVGRSLIFWSLLTPLLFYIYVNLFNPGIIHGGIAFEEYTWEATLRKMYTFLFNFSYDTLVLWYLYMLIGLYFIMPILSTWLEKSSKKEIGTLLKVWILTTFLPYVQLLAPVLDYKGNGGNMGLYGVCDWNPFGMFYYITGFIGYVIAAYYFTNYPPQWSLKKTLAITIPTWAVGYLITFFGFIEIQQLFPNDFSKLELIWFFCGTNVVMMTLSLFLLAQRMSGITYTHRWVQTIASLTFGVYLAHFVVVHFAYDWLYPILPIAPFFKILIMGVVSFLITLPVVWIMSRIPFIKKFVL